MIIDTPKYRREFPSLAEFLANEFLVVLIDGCRMMHFTIVEFVNVSLITIKTMKIKYCLLKYSEIIIVININLFETIREKLYNKDVDISIDIRIYRIIVSLKFKIEMCLKMCAFIKTVGFFCM